MAVPLRVDFRGLGVNPALERHLRERAAKLERFFCGITGCRVVVEAPHRHQRRGRMFQVAIEVDVPGRRLIAGRGRRADAAHADLRAAVRDAFDGAARMLEDYARIRRGDVKAHSAPAVLA